MTRPVLLLLLGCWFLPGSAKAAASSAWQWQAGFEVAAPGKWRLEVAPPVLDVSRPDLADLRVWSPGQVETPYLIEEAVPHPGGIEDGKLLQASLTDGCTLLEVAAGNRGDVAGVTLVSPAREFIKSLTVEGNAGDGQWQTLAADQVVFRQAGGAERLAVAFAPGRWQTLRCTLDDRRSEPVPFIGVRVQRAGEAPEVVVWPVAISKREDLTGETRLTLDLGAANQHVAQLRFDISDAVFSRVGSLAFATPTASDPNKMETCSQGMLYRVVGEQGKTAEQLTITVGRRVPARYLIATFRNGDSPPLTINGIALACYPTVLAFFASESGKWQLQTGNRRATAPKYDLEPLREALDRAAASSVTPGPLHARPDYQAPAALPGVEPAGADIGLKQWTRRRALDLVASGVVRVELDALVLAGSRLDLGDIRLVQNGRQIPYLIEREPRLRDVPPTAVVMNQDPQRPSVTRWELTLPVAGLPAAELTASSAAPWFVRTVVATIDRRDELGNVNHETVGSVKWTKSGQAGQSLVMPLGDERLPQVLLVSTDHGDNPAIEVDQWKVRYRTSTVVAKLATGAPVFVYYGNPLASPPQYDLQLVRAELLGAEQQPLALGPEEILRPERAQVARGVGSPWLWLALAGVVAALLGIVLKLLPRAVPVAGE